MSDNPVCENCLEEVRDPIIGKWGILCDDCLFGVQPNVESICAWLDVPRDIVCAVLLLGNPGTGKVLHAGREQDQPDLPEIDRTGEWSTLGLVGATVVGIVALIGWIEACRMLATLWR